ncbi:hypothetical protein ACIS_00805 [Anaplasma centrale str. Israel]|uniref:Uncharacterized protein n=1 Tax=Anaplasma centrale (strain Israel) TaxID=574556 RepID=D1AS93_ANACI|nr:hypothetical protein [Anaplasma centrale]ACZ49346.1 hypothetical protein ACIS_00805 [Anaplasma centrale str. Israel]
MSRADAGGDGVSAFDDPAYRERYREKFIEAQRRGMDMVVYPDGAIALIENKMVMYTYGWHRRRRDFERVKAGPVSAVSRKRSGVASGVPSEANSTVQSNEDEYA